ncbi:MAG: HD domain-containing protein [Planctomycetes bacterium]|nr:HD domain-containing protein [Planctomycetota bacterium]
MERDLGRGRVFRDPVHDIIFIPRAHQVILDLLETPAVQRLRRVRQLGLAHLVFPGAEHSRFIHSLGVEHLANRILTLIRELGEGEDDVAATLRHAPEIRAAALLHDIGHGPFSHTFENVLADAVGRHETWSRRIVQDPGSEVHSLLRRHGLDVELVAALIEGRAEDLLAQDIVSSQLDADRLDYLLRDSLMTGVAYGKIDLAWILNVMKPGRAADGRVRLGIDGRKGLHAVESYLFARRSIQLQVYHHRTVRAFEAMLANLLALGRRILAAGERLPGETPAAVRKLLGGEALDNETFLALDDSDIHLMLKAWAVDGRWGLAAEATRLARALLRRKCLYLHIDLVGRPAVATEVQARVAAWAAGGDEAAFHVRFDDWESTLYLSARAAVEAGRDRQDALAAVIPIVDEHGAVRPLEQDAPWLDLMHDFPGRQTRLYYDPAWEDRLHDLLRLARNG